MPRARCLADRLGFTLLEVMVALLLFSGTFLIVAQLLAVAARAADQSRAMSIADTLSAQKIEQLRTLCWGYDVDGTPLDELGLSPPGSLETDTAGAVDYLDDSGTPVVGGPPAPAAAAFARRWSIESDAAVATQGGRTLKVAVFRRRVPLTVAGGTPAWTEVTRVVTARARRPG
jgi:prepilin-type N-terminal cleavage/methylation domain-containing protein